MCFIIFYRELSYHLYIPISSLHIFNSTFRLGVFVPPEPSRTQDILGVEALMCFLNGEGMKE